MAKRRDLTDVLESIDPADFLFGCSLPLRTQSPPGHVGHVFSQRQAFSPDALGEEAVTQLADSVIEVVQSIDKLHRRGFVYGRLRLASFHQRGSAAKPALTLWVDVDEAEQLDAVHVGDPESMYWTADRLKHARGPKPADDWYALGIVFAEIALTSESVAKIWDLSRVDGNFVEQLSANLRLVRSRRWIATAARTLIAAGAQGKVDASLPESVCSVARSAGRRAVDRVKPVLWIAALVLLAGATAWNWHARTLVHRDLVAANNSLAKAVGDLERLRSASTVPTQVIEVATPQVNPSAVVSGKRWWTEQVRGLTLEQAINRSANRAEADIQTWQAALTSFASLRGQLAWRKVDPPLRKLVQSFVDQPWDVASLRRAGERIEALDEAYQKWLTWSRSEQSIDELREQHALLPAGQTKDVLGQWLAEILEVRSFDVTVQATEGMDGKWTAHRIGYETESSSDSVAWEWEADSSDLPEVELSVSDYRAGQTLSVWLQQDGSIPFWNTTVVEHQFTSPLLVWRLIRGMRLKNADSGYTLLVKTSRRVGPPVLTNQVTRSNEVPAERKVVDPMDSLPF